MRSRAALAGLPFPFVLAVTVGVTVVAADLGCKRRSDPAVGALGEGAGGGTSTARSEAPPAGSPPVCRDYAARLLRCIEHPRFPAHAREPQRSALRQMMEGWNVEALPAAERTTALAAAADNCAAALETMKESGRGSCPGVF